MLLGPDPHSQCGSGLRTAKSVRIQLDGTEMFCGNFADPDTGSCHPGTRDGKIGCGIWILDLG